MNVHTLVNAGLVQIAGSAAVFGAVASHVNGHFGSSRA